MNEAKLQEFLGKLVVDMGGAALMANVILGEELGLYRAMADGIAKALELEDPQLTLCSAGSTMPQPGIFHYPL